MNPPSSSISSSDINGPAVDEPGVVEWHPLVGADRARWLTLSKIIAWTLAALIVADIAVNTLFRYPTDPKVTNPSQLQMYFEYGRSTEGKLRRMTRPSRDETAPISLAGWYDPLEAVDRIRPGASQTITVYGMSHAVRLAEALARTPNTYNVRSVGAPGASPNWSLGAFHRDRGGATTGKTGKSRVVVLGMMSANLPMITTMSPMTWNVSFPMPYTADRFRVGADGRLSTTHAPYSTFEGYVSTFYDPAKWQSAKAFFAANDPMYNRWLFDASGADRSVIVRLLRRAYGQRIERDMKHAVFADGGFDPNAEQIRVANAMIADFAAQARRDGQIPVVFIVNNFGYDDLFYRALKPTLESAKIPYLSSHTVVSPKDPRGYLPDSHFTDANDDRLAKALIDVIAKAEAKEAQTQ